MAKRRIGSHRQTPDNPLYRGRYIIVFYELPANEELVALVETTAQLAKLLGYKPSTAASVLARQFNGSKEKTMVVRGVRCQVYFISAR